MTRKFIDGFEWCLAVVFVCGVGLVVNAQEPAPPGELRQVGPAQGADRETPLRTRAREQHRLPQALFGQRLPHADRAQNQQLAAPASPYWIGIAGGEVSPELRAHLGQLVVEGEVGVIVQQVTPESPAEKAGLKQHDILVRANGKPIIGMTTLQQEVAAVGPERGEVNIDYLRAGQRKTIAIQPAERPHAARQPAAIAPPQWAPGPIQDPGAQVDGDWVFPQAPPFRLRMFGGGVGVNGANVQVEAPGGVSVRVSNVNGKSRAVVQQGDQVWDIDPSDPEQLAQLPPELQVQVKNMVQGGPGVDINLDGLFKEFGGELGGLFDRPRGDRRGVFGRRRRELRRRMEEMQQQLDALRQELGGDAAGAGAGLNEAPPFVPGGGAPPSEGPLEIEIPAEPEASKPPQANAETSEVEEK